MKQTPGCSAAIRGKSIIVVRLVGLPLVLLLAHCSAPPPPPESAPAPAAETRVIERVVEQPAVTIQVNGREDERKREDDERHRREEEHRRDEPPH